MKNFAEVERDFVREKVLPGFDFRRFDQPSSVNPMRVPVSQAKVSLVVTAGAYLTNEQPPFKLAVDGDPDFREIPGDVELSRLGLSHVGYDTRRALQDVNVVFPLERLRDARQARRIGDVAPRHYSFMGYCPQVEPLMANAATVAARLMADHVELALLVPA